MSKKRAFKRKKASKRNKASDALQPKSCIEQADFSETESFPPLQNGEGVPAMRAGERSTPADIADRYTFTHFLGRGTQGSVYLQPKSCIEQADFAETESFPPLQNGEGVEVSPF